MSEKVNISIMNKTAKVELNLFQLGLIKEGLEKLTYTFNELPYLQFVINYALNILGEELQKRPNWM